MKQIPEHTLKFIDSWLQLNMRWEGIPGLSLTIMHKGKIVHDSAFGLANIESCEALTSQHVFQMASQSKTVTTATIMKLVEADCVNLDDAVSDHLSWLKEAQDPRLTSLTVRQLLTHTSGLPRDDSQRDYWGARGEFPTSQQLRARLLTADLVTEPGTVVGYSNLGYGLLGELAAHLSNGSYQDAVRQAVLEPLGLSATSFDLGEHKMATGYSRPNLAGRRFAFSEIAAHGLSSATGIRSTTSDMARLFDALKPGSGLLLSDESKRQMLSSQPVPKEDTSYGLGLVTYEDGKQTVFGHNGGYVGFSSRTAHWLDDDLTIALAVNADMPLAGRVVSAVREIIDKFGDDVPSEDLLKFETRLTGRSGIVEVVAYAGGLHKLYPEGWWPFYGVEQLQSEGEVSFRICEASGYGANGGLLEYELGDNGDIVAVRQDGSLLLPSETGDIVPWW